MDRIVWSQFVELAAYTGNLKLPITDMMQNGSAKSHVLYDPTQCPRTDLSKRFLPKPESTKQMEEKLNFQVPARPRTGHFTTYTVLSFEAS